MRTWLTLITVGIVLFLIIFTEQMYISDFEESIKHNIKLVQEKISNESISKDDILKLENDWDNSKNLIYVFANHNSFITLENSVSLMKIHVKNKNYEKLSTELVKFKNCIKDFDDSRKFKVSNIL